MGELNPYFNPEQQMVTHADGSTENHLNLLPNMDAETRQAIREQRDECARLYSWLHEYENTAGLCLDRVTGALTRVGLRPDLANLYVIDERNSAFVKGVLSNAGNDDSSPQDSHQGKYYVSLGISTVYRMAELEKINGGATWAEAAIIHELVHMDGLQTQICTYNAQTHLFENYSGGYLRDGYVRSHLMANPDRDWSTGAGSPWHREGSVLEESLPTLIEGMYRQLIHNSPNGIMGGDKPTTSLQKIFGAQCVIPDRYLTYWMDESSPEGRISFIRQCDLGAAGLEILIKLNPDLFDALVEGRHAGTGIRKVMQCLNSIRPDLYFRIMQPKFTPDHLFHLAYDTAQNKLPGQNPEAFYWQGGMERIAA